MNELLNGLNEPQAEAVQHFQGPILVLAGAGSGKTRVLTHRVAFLVKEHQIHPQNILAVTFTNKAANEMKERILKILEDSKQRFSPSDLWVSTFHSISLNILRRFAEHLNYKSNFVIYDSQDSKSLIKSILKEKNIDPKKYPAELFIAAINSAKNKYIAPEDLQTDKKNPDSFLIAEVYHTYQTSLLTSNAMDFGDLLTNCLKLLLNFPLIADRIRDKFKFVLVDEFQDTNFVQYQIIKEICKQHKNLFVVGDDDQSIYAFRGASIENFINFEKDFQSPKLVKLEQNYRSSTTILEAAHAVIKKNTGRKAKKLWTDKDQGRKINCYAGYDEQDEADYVGNVINLLIENNIPRNEIAVFYRTNAQSRALEDALMYRGIPYKVFGGLKFYQRKEIKDLVAYLRLIVNLSDEQAFNRIINTPPRGIGAQTILKIQNFAAENSQDLFSAALEIAQTNNKVKVFTDLILDLKTSVNNIPLNELISKTIEESGYSKYLKSAKDPSAQSRLENIQELKSIAHQLELMLDKDENPLEAFLDKTSLTAADEIPEEEGKENIINDYVSLCTLHLAKGLEFPVVFLTGFEEGLMPHYKSMEEPGGIEEERRLCYVGITRAMKELYLTRARKRGMFAQGNLLNSTGIFRDASCFYFDIPKELLEDNGSNFITDNNELKPPSVIDEFEIEDDLLLASNWWQKKKRSNKKTKDLNSILTSADNLSNRNTIPANEFKVGVKVTHPKFGNGIVRATEGEPDGDPKKFKILVDFENMETPKKLIYKFAPLVLS
ncbi:MAG: UvrD-helicase domain-containing protein [Bdellovibrionales bacterium]|nr:UvrD-helicase domain-containing protein [Bdellovibrionales bacterium]